MSHVRIEYLPLSALKRWPRNPKDHDLGVLHQSIARFGFVQPLLIDERTGQLVAGHGRLDALVHLKEAGQAPPERIIAQDGEWLVPVIRGVSFASDTEAEAYGIADNRLVELGGWDEAALVRVLQDLQREGELAPTGFDDEDLTRLLRDIAHEPRQTPVFDPAQSDAFELSKTIMRGQVWRLGRHRLMCGDSTSPEDVSRLMGGAKAHLLITDPPYLVEYTGADRPTTKDGDRKDKDWSAVYHEIPEKDAERFFRAVFTNALSALADNAAWYVWHGHRWAPMIQMLWREYGLIDHQVLIWAKPRNVFGHSWWAWQHEPCLFGWRRGHEPKADHRVSLEHGTVWQLGYDEGSHDAHPTQKPVELFRRPILAHVARSVLDLFAGSGTSIIAAESVPDCAAYAMEIEPFFCAVTIRRWEAHTDEGAVLATT